MKCISKIRLLLDLSLKVRLSSKFKTVGCFTCVDIHHILSPGYQKYLISTSAYSLPYCCVTALPTRRCDILCPCIGNTHQWHVQNMQRLQDQDINADLIEVFDDEDSEDIRIVMQIFGSERTMRRPRIEKLSKCLGRIETNVKNASVKLQKKLRKKMKKDQGFEVHFEEFQDTFPTITLHDEKGNVIDGELPVMDGWSQSRTLKICDVTYRVVVNPPKIKNLRIVRRPLVGFLIYPQIEFTFAAKEFSKFEWFRRPYREENEEVEMETNGQELTRKHKIESSDTESSTYEDNVVDPWELIGNDQTYTPTPEDCNHELQLCVTPGSENFPVDKKTNFTNSLRSVAASSENPVMDLQEKLLFADRVKLTEERCSGDKFRVVSYNVLANVYAMTEKAENLLFPYCPAEVMDIDYRKQLVIKEITGYNADIICLQEVDRCVFESYYLPVMSHHGFGSAFAAKEGVKEGVALFYRREKFKLRMAENIILRKALKEKHNEDLMIKVSSNELYKKSLLFKPTCLLVVILESKEDSRRILIGNTHLYWHPRGCHIRLIQMEIILREMRRLYSEHSEGTALSCMLTGDLNSHPYSGVVQLVTKGFVPAYHADWFASGKDEHLEDMELSNSALFESACGYPAYTTLVTSFQGCLDYIFIDKTMKVDKIIPQPPNEDVVRHCALPNVTYPSDHIAQVADVLWSG